MHRLQIATLVCLFSLLKSLSCYFFFAASLLLVRQRKNEQTSQTKRPRDNLFCSLHLLISAVCAFFFFQFGIIRDVMQNHLLQILSIIGMEPPLSLSAEDVRDEKVKLLRSIAPITIYDTVVGQYTAEKKPGGEPGYLDEPDVPDDSVTPTYAVCVLHCQNTRWMGVPFILKCGKGLNEKKADIRIQFKTPVNTLCQEQHATFASSFCLYLCVSFADVHLTCLLDLLVCTCSVDDVSPNELVLRVGPDEVVYMKMTTKAPGLDSGNAHTELDLTYKKRFTEEMADMPDAYEVKRAAAQCGSDSRPR